MSTLTIQEPHIPKFPTDLDLPPFLLPLLTNFHKMAFIRLIVLSTIMFVSTFFIGLIPLSFSLSSAKLRAISTFGIGLLVGAALTVIIPEGVESVYKAAREIEESSEGEGGGHDHGAVEGQSKYVGLALLFGFMLMFIIDSLQPHAHPKQSSASHTHGHHHHHSYSPSRPTISRSQSGRPLILPASTPEGRTRSSTPLMRSNSMNFQLSPSYLKQQSELGTSDPNPNATDPPTNREGSRGAGSFSELERGVRHDDDASHSSSTGMLGDSKTSSTIIGLLAHALADGISLGASVGVSSLSAGAAGVGLKSLVRRGLDVQGGNPAWQPWWGTLFPLMIDATADGGGAGHGEKGGVAATSLDLIVFMAIMIHKAPAAFGMVAVLLSSTSPSSPPPSTSSESSMGGLGTAGSVGYDAPDTQLMDGGGDEEGIGSYGRSPRHHHPHLHQETSSAHSSSHRRPTLTKSAIRRVLLLFSSSAPIGAITTYFLLLLLGGGLKGGGDGGARLKWWTGMALLFSGGTFLFVATHVLQGDEHDDDDEDHNHGDREAGRSVEVEDDEETVFGNGVGAGNGNAVAGATGANGVEEEYLPSSSSSLLSKIQQAGRKLGLSTDDTPSSRRHRRLSASSGGGRRRGAGGWRKRIAKAMSKEKMKTMGLMLSGMVAPVILQSLVGHGH